MKNNSVRINFLNPAKIKQNVFMTMKFFVFIMLICNMSLSGVFLVAQDALACWAHITIEKRIISDDPDDETEFDFTSVQLGDFSLSDSEAIDFNYNSAGTYIIIEDELAGWTLEDISCTFEAYFNTPFQPVISTSTENRSATISYSSHDGAIHCIFTNKKKSVNDDCKDVLGNEYFTVAKWNYEASGYVLDAGNDPAYTTNVTGDASSADWTSSPAIAAVVRKAGIDPTGIFPGGTSGTVTKLDRDISHISMCGGPMCGDGNLDEGEECDDGNLDDNDGCSAECDKEAKLIVRKAVIGGSATSSDWTMQIDNGMSFPGNFLGTERWLPVNTYQVTESDYLSNYYTLSYSDDCDSNGNIELSTTTVNTCTLTNTYEAICGDGTVDPGEQCDDGNDINDDSCNNECQPRGELIVKKIVVGGDATSSNWMMDIANGPSFPGSLAGTGNWLDIGMYQVTESPSIPHYNLTYSGDCGDTGMVSVEYDITKTCILTNTYEPFCGDYNVDLGEDCDDGPTGSAFCTSGCKTVPPECGDGKVDSGEQCDDGNDIDDDNCNNNCEKQGELIVKKIVVDGDATSSDWTMLVGSILSFPGSYAGTSNWVKVGGYQVGETPDDMPYTLTYSGDCGETGMVSVEYNTSKTCILTNTYEPFCGDYIKDEGEECDDGPTGSATCSIDCKTIEICDSTISGKKLDYFSEAGLSDWVIALFNGDGLFMATTTTDSNGDYSFNDLCINTYTVEEELKSGWTQMQPLNPDYHTVEIVQKNSDKTGYNFINRKDVGSLKICKYGDHDGSLISSGDQYAVDDWPFLVTYPNQSTSTVRTVEGGCVILTDLPVGTYAVSEEDVDGWVIISPENGSASAEVVVGETAELDFYNMPYGDQGMICGYKYEDTDNDIETPNTTILPNWTIELSSTNNCQSGEEWADSVVSFEPGAGASSSDATKALGEAEQDDTLNYVSLGFGGTIILEFDNLIMNGTGGDIEIFETSSSSQDVISHPESARVYASQTGADGTWVDLGKAIQDSSLDLGSMSWAKYLKLVDESDPLEFSENEDGYDLDGIRIPYCRSDWQVSDTTVTDSEGRYCFYGLSYGIYQVNEILKTSWFNTSPLFLDVVLEYGNETDYNFNNYKQPKDEPYCGDGNLDPGEECDDGNRKNGDGCNANCDNEGGGGGGGNVYLRIVDIDAHCIAEDEAVINWRTNKTATSWVVYGKDSDDIEDATTIQSSTETRNHSVTIDGLTPGVEYYFDATASLGSETDVKTIAYNTNDCVKTTEGEPILTIAKATPQEFANAGDEDVSFSILVTNEGDVTAINAVITDELPDGMVYSDTGLTTKSWNIGDMVPGDTRLIFYTVNIAEDVDPKVLVNVAGVEAENHKKVLDDEDIEILEIIVLAETGFNLTELLAFLAVSASLFGMVTVLRRKTNIA